MFRWCLSHKLKMATVSENNKEQPEMADPDISQPCKFINYAS